MKQENNLKQLAQSIASHTADSVMVETTIPGLSLHHWDQTTEPMCHMMAPSICLIGQGKKRVFLGEDTFVYDANTFLITSIELPVASQIIEASPEHPYLGLSMELNLREISQLMLDVPASMESGKDNRLGLSVSDLDEALLDAFNRLLALINTPEDIPTLAPLIQREIFYRLLKGQQGARLRSIVSRGSQHHQIAQVIQQLKNNFKESVKIEELAREAGLSVSAFHSHFRAMTAMTPLQFLKRMRLNEARRLMLANQLDASNAAYEVGYESPSQFSREYSRMFGAPPMKDIKQLAAARA